MGSLIVSLTLYFGIEIHTCVHTPEQDNIVTWQPHISTATVLFDLVSLGS